jgi:hypothetical protein
VFEVCSTATPVGSQFFTHRSERAGNASTRYLVDACLTSGKTAAWTAASFGARCAVMQPPHSRPSLTEEELLRGWRCCRRQCHPDGPAFVTLAKTPFSWTG